MPLSLDENASQYQIRSYEPGTIQVNDDIYHNNIIIYGGQLIDNWRPHTISDLVADDLEIFKEWKPDILIIGTGSTLTFPKIEIYGELLNNGIGVEIMNSSSACKTYNVLTAEGRNAAIALIIN